MAVNFPGAYSSFVPAATAGFVVNYSRDPKKFKINEMMTLFPMDLPAGVVFRLKPEAQARVNANPQYYEWPDGQPRPIQAENAQDFDTITWTCKRRQVSHPMGYQLTQNAVWDIESTQNNVLANKAMMLRALDFYTVAQDTATYTATDTATNLGGGKWDVATSTARYIQKSIQAAIEVIVQNTVEAVQPTDLVLVVGPTVARKMAASAEIADYLAQSPFAKEWLEFEAFKNQLATWGLPPFLYGIRLIVDTLVKETSAFGASSLSKSFATGATSAYILARPGQLVGVGGNVGFSTIGAFVYKSEEMLTEIIDIPLDKRKVQTVTDTIHIRSVAPDSGYLITAVL